MEELNQIIADTNLTAETISEEQKTILTENAGDLEDSVAKRFGIEKSIIEPLKPQVRPDNSPVVGAKKVEQEEEVDEEDEEKISRIVKKYTTPLQRQSIDNQNSIEVDTFIRDSTEKYPIAAKYRGQILTYMNTPGFERVLARDIFKIVAGDELIKIGAERERVFAEKTRSDNPKVSSARSFPAGAKDWGSASKEDFEAKRAEVLGRSS